jgi:uncharacterized protein
VLEVDLQRRRVALTMRLAEAAAPRRDAPSKRIDPAARPRQAPSAREPAPRGAMAEALARALKR